MLQITIPAVEQWDELKEEFVSTKEQTLQLEHSLVSLSKWESKWCKPYLTDSKKTTEETIDYIRCMTITKNVNPEIYNYLTAENYKQIEEYIDDPMTATTFSQPQSRGKSSTGEQITAELVYYWMIALQIPVEFQKWHLNRLLTLVRVCNVKNQPAKKQNSRETVSRYAALNAARRKKLNSKG